MLTTLFSTAFILYRQHHQAAVVAQHPGLANPEISKIIGEQWRSLTTRSKNEWKALAEVRQPWLKSGPSSGGHRIHVGPFLNRKKRLVTNKHIQITDISLDATVEQAPPLHREAHQRSQSVPVEAASSVEERL